MTRTRSGFLRLPMLAASVVTLFAISAAASYPEWVATNATTAASNVNALATGDFNEDGRPDVVLREIVNYINVALLLPDGTFAEPFAPYIGSSLSGLAVADVTSDGHLDIIVSDKGTNRIIVIPGNGDGTFATPIETTVTSIPSHIAIGDFNGDHKTDVAMQTTDGPALAILAGDGLGHFAEVSRVALSGSPIKVVAGDIDGDSKADVLIARDTTFDYQLFFGKGDGTFDAPLTAGGAGSAASDVVLADLNADGNAEIISTDSTANTITIIVNLGVRTFAAPASYSIRRPFGLVVTDATADGKPDVIIGLADNNALATFPGNGDGTLGTPAFTYSLKVPLRLAAADFDGDGLVDVVQDGLLPSNEGVISIFRSSPGAVTFNFDRLYPTISQGQTESFTATLSTAAGFLALPGYAPALPTGTITLRRGGAIIGSGPLQGGTAAIDVTSLPVGTQTITADYSGDALYRSAVSPSVSVNVITDTTTATLTSSANGQDLPYGQSFNLSASVVSPLPGSLSGAFWLFTDGVRSKYSIAGPPAQWTQSKPIDPSLPAGSHTFVAVYAGNATQPSSTSNNVTVVVRKARPVPVLAPPDSNVHFGEHPYVNVHFEGETFSPVQPTGGNLSLREGNATLATVPCCSNTTYHPVQLPTLSIGTHYLSIAYDGDANHENAQSSPLKVIVYPSSALIVEAEGGPNFIRAYAVPTTPIGGGYLNIYRRINQGEWIQVATHTRSSWDEPNPQLGAVYSFRVEQLDASFNLMATSNIDIATMVSFTDDPILPSTRVKAQHLAEVIAAVNVLRAGAGLAPIALADAGAGQLIRAAHISTIRAAVNEARSTFGASTVPFPSDVTILAPIRIQHMQDLREAVR